MPVSTVQSYRGVRARTVVPHCEPPRAPANTNSDLPDRKGQLALLSRQAFRAGHLSVSLRATRRWCLEFKDLTQRKGSNRGDRRFPGQSAEDPISAQGTAPISPLLLWGPIVPGLQY